MREIRFYRSDSGVCPIETFLDSLSGKQAQKVTWTLQLIEEMQAVPTKYFKKLVNTDDIWEVRVQAGNNKERCQAFRTVPGFHNLISNGLACSSGFFEVFHARQVSEVCILRPEGGVVDMGGCKNHAVGHC